MVAARGGEGVNMSDPHMTPPELVFRSMTAMSETMGFVVTEGERMKAQLLDRRVVERITVERPNLAPNGFWTPGCFQTLDAFHASQDKMLGARFLGEFRRAMAFLLLACGKRKTINRRVSSYGLKHSAEQLMAEMNVAESYVSNGALIVAAVALGYRVERIEGTPNAFFDLAVVREARA